MWMLVHEIMIGAAMFCAGLGLGTNRGGWILVGIGFAVGSFTAFLIV